MLDGKQRRGDPHAVICNNLSVNVSGLRRDRQRVSCRPRRTNTYTHTHDLAPAERLELPWLGTWTYAASPCPRSPSSRPRVWSAAPRSRWPWLRYVSQHRARARNPHWNVSSWESDARWRALRSGLFRGSLARRKGRGKGAMKHHHWVLVAARSSKDGDAAAATMQALIN